jgi:hypothetical protein
MITNIEEAKIVWRGMVATYKRMGDKTHKLIYTANAETGDILEARGLYMQSGKIMDRMAKQLDSQFPDYVFDMHGKFVRAKK